MRSTCAHPGMMIGSLSFQHGSWAKGRCSMGINAQWMCNRRPRGGGLLASRALGAGHQGEGMKWRPWQSYQEPPVEVNSEDAVSDEHGRLVQDRISQEDAIERAKGLFEVGDFVMCRNLWNAKIFLMCLASAFRLFLGLIVIIEVALP